MLTTSRDAPNLLLALTIGTSLATWEKLGTLDRELKILYFYIQNGWKLTVLQSKLQEVPPQAKEFSSVSVPHWRFLPLREWIPDRYVRKVDVIRTNQSVRSEIYVKTAQRWHKPIVLRCGYVRGQQLEALNGLTTEVKKYHRIEGWAFRNATLGSGNLKSLGRMGDGALMVCHIKKFE